MDTFHEVVQSFTEIFEGMEVVDVYGKNFGKVMFMQMPSATLDLNLDDFPYDIESKNVPSEMAYRLLESGFISVNAGWLAKDRIVLPHQVDYITENNIHLKVGADDLPRI